MIEIHYQPSDEINTYKQAVRALIIKDNHIVLMHLDHSNTYVLPGGGLNHNETLEMALKREIKEETGYTLKTFEKVLEITEYHQNMQRLHHIFLCSVEDGQTALNLTKEERDLGMSMVRLTIDEAIQCLCQNQGTHFLSEPIQLREFVALMHGLSHLSNL